MNQPASRGATLFVVCVAHFLMPFMMSAVGVALPAIGREFHATALQLGLVETSYALSNAIFLLAMGRLGDIHGRRLVFQSGIIVFTLAGGMLSQAWSIESMIVLRFLQGLGGAMVMATTFAILVSVFPSEQRGKALGIAVASVYAGISCGPFFGGLLVSGLGWRSIFYLVIPLGSLAWLIARAKLRGEWVESKGEPFDWQGGLVYAAGILLLICGASNLEHGYWAWLLAFAGLTGLGGFLYLEAHTPFPLLNINLIRHNRVFAFSSLASLFNYAATFGVTFFLSLYLQYIKGMSAHEAGMLLMVQPITQAVLSPLCGKLSDHFAAARVATSGMVLCATGLAVAANLDAGSSLLGIGLVLGFLGLGFALFSSPNVSVIMGSVEVRYLGIASSINSSVRTLGMMASMTIITIIFSMTMAGQAVSVETQPAFLQSMRIALLAFCGLCGLGIFCSTARHKQPG
jgi:MFS family permease